MPEDARKAADKELDRLQMIPPESAEHTVVRTYLDWLVSLPWSVSTEDNLDIKHARSVLDEDHFDLEKVKERILEFLAVRKLKQRHQGPDPVLRRTAGNRQDFARPFDRARAGAQVRRGSRSAASATRLRFAAIAAPTSARCPAASSRGCATPARTIRCSSSTKSTSSARIFAATRPRRCSRCSTPSRTTPSSTIISTCRSISPRCCS